MPRPCQAPSKWAGEWLLRREWQPPNRPVQRHTHASAASVRKSWGCRASPWLQRLQLLEEGGELLLGQVPRGHLLLEGTRAVLLPAGGGGERESERELPLGCRPRKLPARPSHHGQRLRLGGPSLPHRPLGQEALPGATLLTPEWPGRPPPTAMNPLLPRLSAQVTLQGWGTKLYPLPLSGTKGATATALEMGKDSRQLCPFGAGLRAALQAGPIGRARGVAPSRHGRCSA